ncbi:MAG: hypothetical protein EOL87_01800 [Spartobacteria bacterium]|nr:hypothetical protein [Spartobacteria bacterium]
MKGIKTAISKSSNHWNFSKRPFASKSGGAGGSALIVALWVLLILSMLIGSFAFDMHIESGITSYQRKRLKAMYLSRAGVEFGKLIIGKIADVSETGEGEAGSDRQLTDGAVRLKRGSSATYSREMGGGTFRLSIVPEKGRRNINTLTKDEWEELLDQANVPDDEWDEMIDCLTDWIDENDFKQLNGAESDDSYYEEAGYEVKNAPLDTVDELLLVKGFSQEILFGTPRSFELEDEDDRIQGMAKWLTTWGDGKVNINSASREVLLSIPGIDEFTVDQILASRGGVDGLEGTTDDGWGSVEEIADMLGLDEEVKKKLTVRDTQYLRVISIGEVGDLRYGVWCIFEVSEAAGVTTKYWREESMD